MGWWPFGSDDKSQLRRKASEEELQLLGSPKKKDGKKRRKTKLLVSTYPWYHSVKESPPVSYSCRKLVVCAPLLHCSRSLLLLHAGLCQGNALLVLLISCGTSPQVNLWRPKSLKVLQHQKGIPGVHPLASCRGLPGVQKAQVALLKETAEVSPHVTDWHRQT